MANELDSETVSSETNRPRHFDPLEIGTLGTIVALTVLAVVPIGGRVRFGNSEYAWLDPYRIPSPSEIGWTLYIIVSLLFCLCYGCILGLLRWGVDLLFPWPLARQTAAILFFVFALLGTWIFVTYFYRHPRMPWPRDVHPGEIRSALFPRHESIATSQRPPVRLAAGR
jgi:hypothetical protein